MRHLGGKDRPIVTKRVLEDKRVIGRRLIGNLDFQLAHHFRVESAAGAFDFVTNHHFIARGPKLLRDGFEMDVARDFHVEQALALQENREQRRLEEYEQKHECAQRQREQGRAPFEPSRICQPRQIVLAGKVFRLVGDDADRAPPTCRGPRRLPWSIESP